MINITQMEQLITTVLKKINLYSEDAKMLVLRTGAVESHYEYIRQLGNGPARSFFQIEPATARYLINQYIEVRPTIRKELEELCLCDLSKMDDKSEDTVLRFQLMSNIALSIALCRIRYRIDRKAIPPHTDVTAQAEYWKRVYNTYLGAGTVEKFIKAAERCHLP